MPATLASSSSETLNAPGTSLTVPLPAGTTAGDHLLAVAVWRDNTATLSVSTWTGEGTWTSKDQSGFGTAIRVLLTWIQVTGTPPASVTFGSTASTRAVAAVLRVTGAPTGDPTDVLGAWGTLDGVWDAPAVTATGDDLLLFFAVGADRNSPPINPPTGMAEVLELNANPAQTSVWLEIAQQDVAAGSTGVKTATGANTSNGTAILWAVKPTGTGTSHTRSMTDLASTVDTLTPVHTPGGGGHTRSLTDPLGLRDTDTTLVLDTDQSLTHPVGLTDTLTVALAGADSRLVADTTTLGDTLSLIRGSGRALADVATLTDTLSLVHTPASPARNITLSVGAPRLRPVTAGPPRLRDITAAAPTLEAP